MKKAIVGFAAIGAVIGLRQVIPRVAQKMREHCEQMIAQFQGRDEAAGHEAMGPEARQKMREHCEQMAAQHEERSEPVATA
jgi:hypothetical protein